MVKRKKMQPQKGFTLIETLIALAILSALGLAVLGAVTTAHKATILTNEKTTASSLARDQMEYIQQQTYEDPPDYAILTIPAEYSGYSYVTSTPMAVDVDTGLQKITVSVQMDAKTLYTLEDYKVNKGE